jgi:aryl-alcohol dehydrogenase-like predicted oxidoreductase
MQRQMFGVGSIPWSPLARGLLTRPFNQDKLTTRSKTDPYLFIYSNIGKEKVVGAVEKIAKAKGVSMAQVSLAWVLAKEGVTAPIVGTTSLENLNDLLGAVNITLSPEEIKELEEGYVVQAAVGHS